MLVRILKGENNMKVIEYDDLYTIVENVECVKCNHKGAIQYYGKYYPYGLGDEVDTFGELTKKIMEKYRDNPYMSNAMGFGGTIPYKCTNCGNVGLIDMGGLEEYEMAFRTIDI